MHCIHVVKFTTRSFYDIGPTVLMSHDYKLNDCKVYLVYSENFIHTNIFKTKENHCHLL